MEFDVNITKYYKYFTLYLYRISCFQLKTHISCFEVVVGEAVFVGEFVAAGDGDVGAEFGEVGWVVVVAGPDEFQALLAAGGGVWDYYCVIDFGGLLIGVGFEPAFYFYYFFFVFFGHNQHVENC